MARLKTANGKEKYRDLNSKHDVINYILNPDKMIHNYCGGVEVDPQNIEESMKQISAHFNKENGVQLRHFIISFYPTELNDPAIANEIAKQATQWLGQKYQTIYSIHEDKPNLHMHIIMNSVSYIDGQRYYGTKKEFNSFRNFLYHLLKNYGLSLVYVSNSCK